jgi:hypothetical protein
MPHRYADIGYFCRMENEQQQQLSYFCFITVVNDPAFRRKTLLTPAHNSV